MKKEKYNITGMTCSSCSLHVENAIKKLNGVKKVNVNLLLNNMIVEYDSKIINSEKIINAVNKAGYDANLSNNKEKKNKIKEEKILSMKMRLTISIIFLIPLMYLSMHHMIYEVFNIPVPQIIKDLFHGNTNAITFVFTQFLLLLPIVYINRNYFFIGFKRLLKRTPNMDSLIALGSSASIIYGIVVMYIIGYGIGTNNLTLVEKYSMDIYFESAGTILTLITLGKYLEEKSKIKTGDAISKLLNLAPNTALVIRNGIEVEIRSEDIVIGDVLVIKPGSSIPVDGIVIDGQSSIDQSSITGESIPIEKKVNDQVISGTINKNGYLKIKAIKVGKDTTLSQIITLVEQASNSKAPISKLADKVSGVFVPIVICISIITFTIWMIMGQGFEFALSSAIAVLVISCPCALGLATPVAIMVGTGVGAKNGIIIKSAESMELLHKIDTVILDKTGTLTKGKPKVTDVISYIDKNEFLKIAGTLEKNSEHPISIAILEKLSEEKIKINNTNKFISISGRGIKGTIEDVEYFGGNSSFIQENNICIDAQIERISKELSNNGKTVVYFATKENVIGIIAVADSIKKESYDVVKKLKNRNIDVYMVTGDNKIVAENIGMKLGIKNIISEVLPKGKQDIVLKLQENGKKVAFVGDGINDSPALTSSDVGIAIGAGTDIAVEAAEIVLMKDNLSDLITTIDLSKSVIKNIKLNLFWAFFYNIIGIPIAAEIFYLNFGLKLNPMIGALAMSFSSVCVVTNALRLNKFKAHKNIKLESKLREESKMKEKIVYIDGMQCNHCRISVENVLKNIDGVKNVEVSLEDKKAIITYEDKVDNEKIKEVIKNANFVVKEIKE